ncbi:MAG: hypothetical protein CVU66_01635 [Deltaproteobacteria bacterium HGW-Deltaproteobacteria-23]|nr:MAG: hypothetical protein CVU66_01635 [Deltaproteobacteria bacterium HGW-Deltaproteobacteria-23]
MTDNHWGGILQGRNSKQVAEEFRKTLAAKMAGVESAEALNLLRRVREELLKEISAGRRIPEEVEALIENLPAIHFADELQSSRDHFLQLAAELYRTRSSVSSTFSLAQSFYDSLITTAFNHAVTQLRNEGRSSSGLIYALLVSGELGRGESILGSRSSFFFIYRETAEADHVYSKELAMRFMAVLSICLPDISRNLNSPSAYWFGSDTQWNKTTVDLLRADDSDNWDKAGGNSFTLFIETVADMRIVCGDPDFGRGIIATGRKLLADYLKSDNFWHLAKDTATMPVALGVFSRFKTVRSGSNRGKIDLKKMAIDPLANAARILSLADGKEETTFSGRIKSILAAGNLGVALADGLLIAYQDFMRERIRLELTANNGNDGLFFDPEELDEESKERFRAGLDDTTTLQRLIHQQLVEVESG